MRELKREGKGQDEYERGGVSFGLSLPLSFDLSLPLGRLFLRFGLSLPLGFGLHAERGRPLCQYDIWHDH